MKHLRKNIDRSGFSLVELMVALLIFAILMVTVISVFLMSQKLYTRGENISYKQKSITNIETALQNALSIADVNGVKISSDITQPGTDYAIGFNSNGDCVEVIKGSTYITDQITEITLKNNGSTMKYEIVPKDSMSTLKGGIVMNNIKSAAIDTTLKAGTESYLVITLAD